MKKIRIVFFLENVSINDKFLKWPNHVTLTPSFEILDLSEFVIDIKSLCQNFSEFSYEIGSVDYFGINKNVKVSRIKSNTNISRLHAGLIKIIYKYSKNFDDSYIQDNYKPHITHNNTPYPEEGQIVKVGQISIVEYTSDVSKKVNEYIAFK